MLPFLLEFDCSLLPSFHIILGVIRKDCALAHVESCGVTRVRLWSCYGNECQWCKSGRSVALRSGQKRIIFVTWIWLWWCWLMEYQFRHNYAAVMTKSWWAKIIDKYPFPWNCCRRIWLVQSRWQTQFSRCFR